MSETQEFSYEDRYGKVGGNRWVAYAFAISIVGLLWIFWAGLHHANPAISSQLISFEVTGEKEISLRYSINRTDPDQVVICTLQALDIDKNVVGQIDDTIPAGKSSSQQAISIPTRSAPFTASIVRCRAE
jgi:Domain of unknown function (DUF4307)